MMQFSSVAVVVSDAKAAAKWWTEKLGFEPRDTEGHWITVAPKGGTTTLHLCENGTHEEGNTGFGFEVADVEGTQAALMAKGVKFPQPAEKKPWGSIAHFADPDGNVYWLSENPDLAPKTRAEASSRKRAPARKTTKKPGAKKPARTPAKKAGKKARRR